MGFPPVFVKWMIFTATLLPLPINMVTFALTFIRIVSPD